MKEILFICHGNVGRSQMAEAFYNQYRGCNQAISAGIQDVREKYHGSPTSDIIQVMLEKGIDVSKQQIKQVNEGMLRQAQQVVVLCDEDLCPNFIISNPNVVFATIPDPFLKSVEDTRAIRDQIEAIVRSLI